MADFPLIGNRSLVESIGFNLGTSEGTSITSVSSGDSAWSELVASTSQDSDLLALHIMRNGSGTFTQYRLDIGVGPAGSEQVRIDDILLSGKPNATSQHFTLTLPLNVPLGSRISFRANFSASGRVLEVAGALYAGQFKSEQALCDTIAYGFNGIDGVDVDPGGIANTKGAWSELDASVSDGANGFYLCTGDSINSAQGSLVTWLVDVGIGPAGFEEIIAENIPVFGSNNELIKMPVFVDVVIPIGVRLSVRAQCTNIDVTDRLISSSIVGFI